MESSQNFDKPSATHMRKAGIERKPAAVMAARVARKKADIKIPQINHKWYDVHHVVYMGMEHFQCKICV
jgi:hypothetical protein